MSDFTAMGACMACDLIMDEYERCVALLDQWRTGELKFAAPVLQQYYSIECQCIRHVERHAECYARLHSDDRTEWDETFMSEFALKVEHMQAMLKQLKAALSSEIGNIV